MQTYPQGNISKYLSELKLGDKIAVKGPKGQMRYDVGLARHIGMIAGGTGLTPCLQIIRAVLKNPKDKTRLDLIYANVEPEDILLKKELDELAGKYKDRFAVQYFLNKPPSGWTGGEGFVTKEAIKEYLPAPAQDIKILMCGESPLAQDIPSIPSARARALGRVSALGKTDSLLVLTRSFCCLPQARHR